MTTLLDSLFGRTKRAAAQGKQVPREALAAELAREQAAALAEAKRIDAAFEKVLAESRAEREKSDAAAYELHCAHHANEARVHRATKIESELRASCDPALADHGPLKRWLRAVDAKACRHLSITDPQEDEGLRFLEKRNPKPVTSDYTALAAARKAKAERDVANSIRSKVAEAMRRINDLQIAPKVEPSEVERLVNEIPTTCACGKPLPALREFNPQTESAP